jgi:hypothetical protein
MKHTIAVLLILAATSAFGDCLPDPLHPGTYYGTNCHAPVVNGSNDFGGPQLPSLACMPAFGNFYLGNCQIDPGNARRANVRVLVQNRKQPTPTAER